MMYLVESHNSGILMMKTTKLILLSSIFLMYGTYEAMSAAAVATPAVGSKRTFSAAELEEEIDPNADESDAARMEAELKEKISGLKEEVKRVKTDSTAQIKALEEQITAAEKEKKQTDATVGNERVEKLKQKIARHMDKIKEFDEQIKQTTTDQASALKQLKDEKDAQIKELTESNAAALKELNDQKALSMAKKAAREKELATLKGAKASGTPQSKQQVKQKAALNAQIENQGGKPVKKVNAVVDSASTTTPQSGLGGLFSGLQAIQATVEKASQKAATLSDVATGTIQNAASQVDGIKGQIASAQESVGGLLPQSVKLNARPSTTNVINI